LENWEGAKQESRRKRRRIREGRQSIQLVSAALILTLDDLDSTAAIKERVRWVQYFPAEALPIEITPSAARYQMLIPFVDDGDRFAWAAHQRAQHAVPLRDVATARHVWDVFGTRAGCRAVTKVKGAGETPALRKPESRRARDWSDGQAGVWSAGQVRWREAISAGFVSRRL
jgi:hypothetical protein